MKNVTTILILLFLLCGVSFKSNAQGFVISNLSLISNPDNGCDSVLRISVSSMVGLLEGNEDYNLAIGGTNYSAGPINVDVDWGDGTSSSHTGYMSNSGGLIQMNPKLIHYYPGSNYQQFPVILTASNPNNQSTLSETLQFATYWGCQYELYANVGVDCDQDGYADSTLSNVPFILTQNTGPSHSGVFGLNPSQIQGIYPGTININIDPVWLAANGYATNSGSLTASVYAPKPNIYDFNFVLHCDTVIPNNGCIQGFVFCDQDNDGNYNSGDFGLHDAPVSIQYNGATDNLIAGNSGNFYMGYTDPNQGSATVSIDNQWLLQNNVVLLNSSQTVANITCDSINFMPLYFPANCSASNYPDRCIKLQVFCDDNENLVMDAGESLVPYTKVNIVSGSAGSNLSAYAAPGSVQYNDHNLMDSAVVLLDKNYLQTYGYKPLIPTLKVGADCNSSGMQYFPVQCNPQTDTTCGDLISDIRVLNGYYQNYSNPLELKWKNLGGSTVDQYKLTLTFPNGVSPVLSTINNSNYTISGNTIEWILMSNSPTFNRTDVIEFTSGPGIPNGTIHYYTTNITPLLNSVDCDNSNNEYVMTVVVGASYDPNDKIVNNPRYIDPAVDGLLEYRIRFQNTGTAPAQDVYVIDTLSNLVDPSTFELLDASHQISVTNLGGNVMKFSFNGIWLPDSTSNEPASHGEFRYRIKEYPGNNPGSTIENTAYIYFDSNPAVVTNTTKNTNSIAGLGELTKQDLLIYPNPAKDVLQIRTDFSWDMARIYSVEGKLMFECKFTKELAVDQLKSGMYVIELLNGNDRINTRFIKE